MYFRFLGKIFLVYLVSQTLLRLGLFLSSAASVSWAPLDVLRTFGLGLAFDSLVGGFFAVPAALLLFLFPFRWLGNKLVRGVFWFFLFFFNFLLVFSTISQVFFWQEYHTNFNFIAVDYLIYTTEVMLNIYQTYPVEWIIPCWLIATWLLTRWMMKQLRHLSQTQPTPSKLGYVCKLVLCGVLLAGLFFGLKDDYREKVSDNQYNIELAGDGPYGFVYAFFHNELDYNKFYRTQEQQVVLRSLRNKLQNGSEAFLDKGITRHVDNTNALTDRKLNVVMIAVESLSADFSGVFGEASPSLTPKLDALAKDSYIYTHMYATGTRTVRGLEALSLAVPPTPGQSILRRPDSSNMATIGDAFQQNGYKTDFIYGGLGYFDNMNGFFESNGYTIKDETSIPKEEIIHETAWGVADEVLFTQVLKSMDDHYAKGEPTYEMVLTTSNHSPYTYPEGRVEGPMGKRPGAVLYTDWAIADFLERAKDKPWFSNTVFVIVADHQAAVAGRMALPVGKYHIPCMIYAPGIIEPGVCDRLISQIDLGPTLLGQLGLSYTSRFMGQDIAKVKPENDRAFISTYQSLGYIHGDNLVVLTPNRKAAVYKIEDWTNSVYEPTAADDKIIGEAVTWYQGASDLYHDDLLKRP